MLCGMANNCNLKHWGVEMSKIKGAWSYVATTLVKTGKIFWVDAPDVSSAVVGNTGFAIVRRNSSRSFTARIPGWQWRVTPDMMTKVPRSPVRDNWDIMVVPMKEFTTLKKAKREVEAIMAELIERKRNGETGVRW